MVKQTPREPETNEDQPSRRQKHHLKVKVLIMAVLLGYGYQKRSNNASDKQNNIAYAIEHDSTATDEKHRKDSEQWLNENEERRIRKEKTRQDTIQEKIKALQSLRNDNDRQEAELKHYLELLIGYYKQPQTEEKSNIIKEITITIKQLPLSEDMIEQLLQFIQEELKTEQPELRPMLEQTIKMLLTKQTITQQQHHQTRQALENVNNKIIDFIMDQLGLEEDTRSIIKYTTKTIKHKLTKINNILNTNNDNSTKKKAITPIIRNIKFNLKKLEKTITSIDGQIPGNNKLIARLVQTILNDLGPIMKTVADIQNKLKNEIQKDYSDRRLKPDEAIQQQKELDEAVGGNIGWTDIPLTDLFEIIEQLQTSIQSSRGKIMKIFHKSSNFINLDKPKGDGS